MNCTRIRWLSGVITFPIFPLFCAVLILSCASGKAALTEEQDIHGLNPAEHEYTQAGEGLIEQKRPVKIITEEFQQAPYDGNPKRIQASSEPPVRLFISYYPNRQLMETAQRAVGEAPSGGNPTRRLTQTFSGYRRVEQSPVEQGTYYVWIYFPGDDNHETAHAQVEFTIIAP